jgi:hypothetical protein
MNKKNNSYKLLRYWCEYTWKLTKVNGVILKLFVISKLQKYS